MPYEVLAARYGTRQTVKSDVFLNYGSYAESDAPIGMDYFFWIVRSPERTILVDTGFSHEGGDKRSRTRLDEQTEMLARLGITPADVDAVVVSHAHYDHIGGLPAFPDAEVLIARTEFDFWTGPLATRSQFAHSAEDAEITHLVEIRDADRMTFVQGSHTLAPGIEIVEVGGHTPGQTVVLVDTGAGQVVLASDAMHYYEEVERDRPFSTVADLAGMYRAFDMLAELGQKPDTAVVAGHDPLVADRFTALDGEPNVFSIA